MSLIEINNVSFAYPEAPAAVLRDISLHVEEGEFVCLVGHSGCGKSTLLRLLAGLSQPTAGQVLVAGEEVAGPSTTRSMVFQHYSLFPWMTAKKNVAFTIRKAHPGVGRAEANERAMHYLAQVGMEQAADKYSFQLSGGMCQRVAIARALAMDSKIMLLDEPFGALDARNRRQLQDLLVKLWHETQKTFVFVTHDIDESILLADRIIFMRPGRIERTFEVNIPRPRDNEDPTEEFKALRREIRALFYLDEGACDE